ncbi:MAG: hypothetical protein HY721_04780 [Planctomycetes bacterium]|nr:hypothetical protein [Planctomycetota bacterium]
MVFISNGSDRHVVLENVRWSTFQALLRDLGQRRARVSYDRGTLEILSPSKCHEGLSRLLGKLYKASETALVREFRVKLRGR